MNKTAPATDPNKESYFEWLRSEAGGWSSDIKDMGDGFFASAKPFLFHWTLIMREIGNKFSYLDRWFYTTQEEAEAALKRWDGHGEPDVWHRHPACGRRRHEGDPEQEYVAP